MGKTDQKSAGEAMPTESRSEGLTTATADSTKALVQSGDGDVSGPLALAFSQDLQDQLMLELGEALHQVSEGFGNLIAPGEIFKRDVTFTVIDAITIPDYVDKTTGEEKIKHIFKLETEAGDVLLTMQSDARPRRVLAQAFQKARMLGQRIQAGPYKYDQKATGQIQKAFILVPQKGFYAGLVRPSQRAQVSG